MKRLLTVLLAGISAAFASCGDDGAEKGDTWFLKPEAVVSGTTAEISCRTKFADGVLTESGAGFVYTRIGAADGYFDAEPVEVSGNALSCRLSDLEPETDYLVYAYLELGGAGRMQSESVSFRTGTGSDPGNAPVFGQPGLLGGDLLFGGGELYVRLSGRGACFRGLFPLRDGRRFETRSRECAAGAKSVRLSGLDASTDYTFRLCVAAGGKTYESGEAAFTTDAGDGPGPGPNPGLTKFSGWPELPVEVKNGDYHYAYHTISDFKVGNYNARNYTVCYSAENHGPVWVAAPLHNCYVTKSGNRSYSQDPDVPAGIQPASKSLASPYNKGHMLGNRERSRTAVMRRQVCYYTNIAPQHGGTFNTGGGAWNNLEDLIDTYWDSTESANVGDTLYVVVGAYYKTWTDSYGNTASPKKAAFGGQQAGVPTMFYYAMLRTKNAKSGKSVLRCSREELQCAAFVMSHAMQKGHKPLRSDMRSVAEVERLSGFQFFTNVPNAPKDTYNPSDWGL